MIIVRETFVAKPGMASKLAKLLSDAVHSAPDRARVLTDLVGPFNTVVVETEVETLSAFDKRMREYRTDERMRSKMAGYTDLYTNGRREIYQTIE
jgi:hypothetical protein